MKIVLWVGRGHNQVALAQKIHNTIPLAGIVLEKTVPVKKRGLKVMISGIAERVFLPVINRAWFGTMYYYKRQYPVWPEVPVIEVSDINSETVQSFTKALGPDLIMVSGTQLVKKSTLNVFSGTRIMNLHTGLSPYVRGGPNCTNWCISTGQFHLIGNTVMWIDEGIDSGNLIATELTPLNGEESLRDIHFKVMEHAHDLYIRSLQKVAEDGKAGLQQDDVAKGKTYYTRQWGLSEKIKLVRNLKPFKRSMLNGETAAKQKLVKTVKL